MWRSIFRNIYRREYTITYVVSTGKIRFRLLDNGYSRQAQFSQWIAARIFVPFIGEDLRKLVNRARRGAPLTVGAVSVNRFNFRIAKKIKNRAWLRYRQDRKREREKSRNKRIVIEYRIITMECKKKKRNRKGKRLTIISENFYERVLLASE